MRVFIALAVVTLIILALASAISAQIARPAYDPAAMARAELEAARVAQQRQIDEALIPFRITAAAVLTMTPALLVLGAAAWGAAALTRFRRERMPRRGDGLLPLPLASIDRNGSAALDAYHSARAIEAGRQPVPHTLSYHHAPRLDHRGSTGGSALPAPDDTAPSISVPSFGALLDDRRVGAGHPLLLGYNLDDNGAEIVGSWRDLYSTATAGLPGSGKTTSQRFFACQTALHGARFVICDPHGSAGDDSLTATLAPLRSVFLCEPAEAPRDILTAVRFVADEGRARLSGRSDTRAPVILWCDELTALLGRSDVGADLMVALEEIAQEHRKVNIFLSASGQIWTATRTSSELRDSLASVLAHRMKRNQARLLLPTAEAARCEQLGTGEAILWRTSGASTRVGIPLTTGADVTRVAALLADPSSPAPAPTASTRSFGFRAPTAGAAPVGATVGAPVGATVGAEEEPLRPHQEAINLTPEEARIVAAFKAGKSAKKIAEELSGVKGGDAYGRAAALVAAALRKAIP